MTTGEIFLMLGIIASIPFIFHFINFTGKEIIEGTAEIIEKLTKPPAIKDDKIYSLLLNIKNEEEVKKIKIDEILFSRYKPGQIISLSYKKGRLNKAIKIIDYEVP
jgi:hypothetical protein